MVFCGFFEEDISKKILLGKLLISLNNTAQFFLHGEERKEKNFMLYPLKVTYKYIILEIKRVQITKLNKKKRSQFSSQSRSFSFLRPASFLPNHKSIWCLQTEVQFGSLEHRCHSIKIFWLLLFYIIKCPWFMFICLIRQIKNKNKSLV